MTQPQVPNPHHTMTPHQDVKTMIQEKLGEEKVPNQMMDMLVLSFMADLNKEDFPIRLSALADNLNVNKANLKRLLVGRDGNETEFEEKRDFTIIQTDENSAGRPEAVI